MGEVGSLQGEPDVLTEGDSCAGALAVLSNFSRTAPGRLGKMGPFAMSPWGVGARAAVMKNDCLSRMHTPAGVGLIALQCTDGHGEKDPLFLMTHQVHTEARLIETQHAHGRRRRAADRPHGGRCQRRARCEMLRV